MGTALSHSTRVSKNENPRQQKSVGDFLICENPDEYNEYINNNLPYSKREGKIKGAEETDYVRITPFRNSYAYNEEIGNEMVLPSEDEDITAQQVADVIAFSTYNVPYEELISAGNEALIESANRFDPTYGTHFISYAVRNIRQSMFDTVNEYYQTVHIPSNRLKDVKIHYESFEVFDSPYADGDDDDYLAPRPFSASRWSLANRFVSSKRTR